MTPRASFRSQPMCQIEDAPDEAHEGTPEIDEKVEESPAPPGSAIVVVTHWSCVHRLQCVMPEDLHHARSRPTYLSRMLPKKTTGRLARDRSTEVQTAQLVAASRAEGEVEAGVHARARRPGGGRVDRHGGR
jgi:hypothetical protein